MTRIASTRDCLRLAPAALLVTAAIAVSAGSALAAGTVEVPIKSADTDDLIAPTAHFLYYEKLNDSAGTQPSIFRFDSSSGALTSRPANDAAGIRPGPDDSLLWLSVVLTDPVYHQTGYLQIVRMDADGSIHRFGRFADFTDGPPEAEVLAVGPDGTAWVDAEGLDGIISRVTPDGVVHRTSTGYSGGLAGFVPEVAPDGSLWLLDSDRGQIVHLSSQGRRLRTVEAPNVEGPFESFVLQGSSTIWAGTDFYRLARIPARGPVRYLCGAFQKHARHGGRIEALAVARDGRLLVSTVTGRKNSVPRTLFSVDRRFRVREFSPGTRVFDFTASGPGATRLAWYGYSNATFSAVTLKRATPGGRSRAVCSGLKR